MSLKDLLAQLDAAVSRVSSLKKQADDAAVEATRTGNAYTEAKNDVRKLQAQVNVVIADSTGIESGDRIRA